MKDDKQPGQIVWHDLTVDDAEHVRDFYQQVVGWTPDNVSMGEYNDFSMKAADGETVAGVCHRRGPNKNLPAQWLMYVRVDDVKASAEKCVALGGSVLDGPKAMGSSEFAVIKDTAGACLAIYSD